MDALTAQERREIFIAVCGRFPEDVPDIAEFCGVELQATAESAPPTTFRPPPIGRGEKTMTSRTYSVEQKQRALECLRECGGDVARAQRKLGEHGPHRIDKRTLHEWADAEAIAGGGASAIVTRGTPCTPSRGARPTTFQWFAHALYEEGIIDPEQYRRIFLKYEGMKDNAGPVKDAPQPPRCGELVTTWLIPPAAADRATGGDFERLQRIALTRARDGAVSPEDAQFLEDIYGLTVKAAA